ncbi:hypothetical protein BCR34DRAFT_591903 [Clohesyomyces aquaticus]|uniref:Rhodopsin domain-containing protein n=1 Tax=Clohesyomyces aquaticus TaxID=1231657 RepID=A0A1Y1YWQ1_9PLEO|nr:hypothetical protein BCR34DRAFT_591903 [Clohesyomyces aquaticus]
MREIPVEVLLSWPAPNYKDPVTRGNALVIVNGIFVSILALVVALRIYTRIVVKRWFGSDDVFIILAFIFAVALTVLVIIANESYGWSRHIYDIPFTQFAPTLKIGMAAKLMFVSAATFTRMSLLFFYYRLVTDSGKLLFTWAIHASVAFQVTIFIVFIFIGIFQCNPVSDYWTGAQAGSCLDEGIVTLAVGIINCVADINCTVLPMPMAANLQMPTRQRIAVMVLFSLGFVVTITGIVRTYYIYKSLIAEYDTTWYAYPLWIAAAVEIDLGVICASTPVLRPLLSKLPWSLSSFSSKFTSRPPSSDDSPATIGSSGNSSRRTNPSSYSKSVANSKRRSIQNTIVEEPEPSHNKGHNLELRDWEDVESRANSDERSVLESQVGILGSVAEYKTKLVQVKQNAPTQLEV